jgi:hypothetical protein
MENMFLNLLKEKMLIFKTKCLVHYFLRCKENNSFILDYFLMLSKILSHHRRPNVNNEFVYTNVMELF